MPDITMCKGDGCPIRATCYRYNAKPSNFQSWFTKLPFEGNTCEYYVRDLSENKEVH